jgi:hypothetical protein
MKHHGTTVIGVVSIPMLLFTLSTLKKCASCASYPDGQANCLTFQRKVHKDVMTTQQATRVEVPSG